MKRLSATLIALGLATAFGTASAQTYGGYSNGNYPNGNYSTVPDRYGNSTSAIYDYARVIRVDPVIDSRYGNNGYNNGYANNNRGYTVSNGQRCYETSGPYNGGYASNNGTYRTNDPYYPQQGAYGTNTGRTIATVVGGIAGAVLGSKVGGGSGTYAATAIGSMVGGLAGRQIYESSQRRRYEGSAVQVCEPVNGNGYYGNNNGYANNGYNNGYGNNNGNGYYASDDSRVAGYDVTYEYAGRQFRTRTNYHPGDRIRVRVDVRPE
jgi:uncharacterized protein YcfJ